MILFDTDHLIVGLIKQLLAEFPLPNYKVYTKEQQDFFNLYGREKDVIESDLSRYDSSGFPAHMRYVPYIKDNKLQIYAKTSKSSEPQWLSFKSSIDSYFYGKKCFNAVRYLKIQNNIYDSYTHEYLGDYLRFKRDYLGIDLMPLYNCFSNKICNALSYKLKVSNTQPISYTEFNSNDSNYKIYMLPVKLFKKYTIAIDCPMSVEICCGVYGKYQDNREKLHKIPEATYQRFDNTFFQKPILYDKLATSVTEATAVDSTAELAQNEQDLKMFIKIPANNDSSIVVLEGDYRSYNDGIYAKLVGGGQPRFKRYQNHTITNYEGYSENRDFKPITALQLLRANTKISHPFADRLLEYLSGNAITPEDEILDNVRRVLKVMKLNTENSVSNSKTEFLNKSLINTQEKAWQSVMRPILYDALNSNVLANRNDTNHDILGYVDKDIEAQYFAYTENNLNENRPTVTISNVDLYTDTYGKYSESEGD